MGLVQMNNVEGSAIPKRPAELNQHMRDEQNARGEVTGEGQELLAEDELRINDNVGDENDGRMVVLKIENHINQSDPIKRNTQQQTQGPLVRWERFLPVRSLKVLLVENDDSTRHVVCALLRNCGYEVVAVANGLQAWKVLEDLTANIDLVLTEVVLPCLTGIGLLSKIMSHKSCKNIPVIMMSSHDSMSVVFKCLSRGAVDFLVKPIRKNELRNLWQHVWRKCHSSSGSGSESGVRTQKSLKSESGEHSDNKRGNYDEDDIGSIGLNAKDRSDNGSGTQSSWTKMAVEVDSPRPMSPWEKLEDPPASGTCAQVIHLMPKTTANNQMPSTKDCEKDALTLDKVTDTDLEIAVPRSIPTLLPFGQWEEGPSNVTAYNNKRSSEKEKVDGEQEKGQVELNRTERSIADCKILETNPTGVVTDINSNSDPLLEIQVLDNPNGFFSNVKDKNMYGGKEVPSFQFSSKSLNGTAHLGSSAQDQSIVKQSHRSAFSRYNSASHQAPTGNVGSCSPIDNSSEAAKTESMQGMRTYLNCMPPNQHSNGSNNSNDMGSSTNIAFTNKPSAAIDKPALKATIKSLQPSSAFQPAENVSPQTVAQENDDKQHIQVQHHHHHHHHRHHHRHHYHMHNVDQLVNQNGQSLQNKTTTSFHESSPNPLSAPIKSDAGNQSLNGSASGSHHGSNAHVGNNVILLSRAGNVENDVRQSERMGTTSGIRFETPNAPIENRFAQREAALNKFRQKRKERCFEKRVRYQSRKKLAEQRPRVRGQFVRHAVEENKGEGTLQ